VEPLIFRGMVVEMEERKNPAPVLKWA
jgi:hypothetical protein